MTFLPIVERELRVAARRTHSYRTRTLAAFVTCIVLSGILITAGQLPTPMKMGQSLFSLVALGLLDWPLAFAHSQPQAPVLGVVAPPVAAELRDELEYYAGLARFCGVVFVI